MNARPTLVIHGGAGTLTRRQFTAALETTYRDALTEALWTGHALLAAGADALEVATRTVAALEDCPLFNAGRGSVLTAAGGFELDAAVMAGRSCRAGAVAGVSTVRNPVLAARLVLEHTPHVLMIGAAAERLAEAHGLAPMGPDYFRTETRERQLNEAIARQAGAILDHDGRHAASIEAQSPFGEEGTKYGTVGAVALDGLGHLAAATSTGGLTNKLPGRVGDSALIGAGCYADDRTLAASATGTGEKFIEIVACHRAAAMMEFGGSSVTQAAHDTIHERLTGHGGRGGLIAIDRHGRIAMPFNTEGMYRGWIRLGDPPRVAIFADEVD